MTMTLPAVPRPSVRPRPVAGASPPGADPIAPSELEPRTAAAGEFERQLDAAMHRRTAQQTRDRQRIRDDHQERDEQSREGPTASPAVAPHTDHPPGHIDRGHASGASADSSSSDIRGPDESIDRAEPVAGRRSAAGSDDPTTTAVRDPATDPATDPDATSGGDAAPAAPPGSAATSDGDAPSTPAATDGSGGVPATTAPSRAIADDVGATSVPATASSDAVPGTTRSTSSAEAGDTAVDAPGPDPAASPDPAAAPDPAGTSAVHRGADDATAATDRLAGEPVASAPAAPVATSSGTPSGTTVGPVQSAPAAPAPTAAQVPDATLDTSVAPGARAVELADLGERLGASLRRNVRFQSLSMHLHPAELGALRIDAKLVDGVTHLVISPDSATGGERLAGALRELRHDLARAGVDVGDLDLRHGADHGASASGRDRDARQGPTATGAHGTSRADPTASNAPSSTTTTPHGATLAVDL